MLEYLKTSSGKEELRDSNIKKAVKTMLKENERKQVKNIEQNKKQMLEEKKRKNRQKKIKKILNKDKKVYEEIKEVIKKEKDKKKAKEKIKNILNWKEELIKEIKVYIKKEEIKDKKEEMKQKIKQKVKQKIKQKTDLFKEKTKNFVKNDLKNVSDFWIKNKFKEEYQRVVNSLSQTSDSTFSKQASNVYNETKRFLKDFNENIISTIWINPNDLKPFIQNNKFLLWFINFIVVIIKYATKVAWYFFALFYSLIKIWKLILESISNYKTIIITIIFFAIFILEIANLDKFKPSWELFWLFVWYDYYYAPLVYSLIISFVFLFFLIYVFNFLLDSVLNLIFKVEEKDIAILKFKTLFLHLSILIMFTLLL